MDGDVAILQRADDKTIAATASQLMSELARRRRNDGDYELYAHAASAVRLAEDRLYRHVPRQRAQAAR